MTDPPAPRKPFQTKWHLLVFSGSAWYRPSAAPVAPEGRSPMARIKIGYIGGGSTRAAGTMASLIHQGENFEGSEVVLVDLDPDALEVVRTIAERMAAAAGTDLTVTATTDRRAGLAGCDAVLTSYRPGGFEARALDERLPLAHGVIGQETHGPGGFFMALRSIHALQPMLDDMAAVCPDAILFNYTNPINVVAQAVADNTDVPVVALCEGPIVFPAYIAAKAGLDPELVDTSSVGLNHASWSVRHRYGDGDLIEALRAAWAERSDDPGFGGRGRRLVHLAVTMGTVPSGYFEYYYFESEVLAELAAKPTTRAEDILGWVPDYWDHYREQARAERPVLDPSRSRGGIHELELAIDCMDAVFNDRDEVMPVNVVNRGSVPGLPDDVIVETEARCDRAGIHPLPMPGLPRQVHGLVSALADHQQLAADAAWRGTAADGVRALAAHPLVRSLEVAERLYADLALAHRDHLPDRLVPA
jgi:6-phospho-beta-glucosidase